MKKKNGIRILATALSLIILWGLFSPVMAFAASDKAYASGVQKFFDDGNHTKLVDCADAVYMEYAEQLRTDRDAVLAMNVLGFIYGGLKLQEKIEPNKERYKEALLNIIRTYEEENAETISQQNLQNDEKTLKAYLHDTVDGELDLLDAIGATDWLDDNLWSAASVALSIINEMTKDADDLVKGISSLKTTLQNYEKYDAFLQLIITHSEGELKLAATELSIGLSEIMKIRLLSYSDLVKDSAEDYAKLFVSEMFAESFFNVLEKTIDKHIGKITYLQAFQAVKLGIDIGKIAGNILVGAEDVISYIVEIKAVHDISVVLEKSLDGIMNDFQKDKFNITETDMQKYISYGNYLISCRIRGQYCMTAIYLQPSLRSFLSGNAAKNAEALYNRLSNDLLSIKKELDAICSGTGLTPVLSGIKADSIQYHNCSESGNFAVIEKNGKYGIIGYDGEMILPIEYESIGRGFEFSYNYLTISTDKPGWNAYVDRDGAIAYGYPDGGGMNPSAYWYEDGIIVFDMDYGIMDIEDFHYGVSPVLKTRGFVMKQRDWNSDKLFPIRKISGYINVTEHFQQPQFDTKNFAMIDMETHELISDFIYEDIDDYNGVSEGLLAVKKDGKWGFLNEDGTVVIDFLYDPYESYTYYDEIFEYVYTAVNGYISVLKDGKWGLIDTQGNIVIDISYDGISQVNPDGFVWLKENDLWSLYQLGN